MSAVFGSPLARRALHRLPTQRVSGVRGMAEYSGPWPGPNPLKDIFIGFSIGLVFAVGFKSWQIKDKAERVRFYQEYERANRVEEALAAKRRAAQKAKEEEEEEEEDEEEEHEEKPEEEEAPEGDVEAQVA